MDISTSVKTWYFNSTKTKPNKVQGSQEKSSVLTVMSKYRDKMWYIYISTLNEIPPNLI